METHTITTYSLANEAFLRTYFPECVYGLTPSRSSKRESVKCYVLELKSQLIRNWVGWLFF